VSAEEPGEVKLKVKSQKAGQDKAVLKLPL
jgi:hypothetical protein